MLPFELTKDTPYLALSGELWSVFYEYFNRNWPCYKGFLLYSETGSFIERNTINSSPHSAAYTRLLIWSAFVQIMACRLFGTKTLSKNAGLLSVGPLGTNFSEI